MYRAHITQKDGPERSQEMRDKLVTLGRADEGNGIVLPRGNVSKSHATLEFMGDSWLLSDLASTNGTYLNGKRIGQPSTVWPGDRVHIGDFMMRFELLDNPESSASAVIVSDMLDVESEEFDNNPTAFRAEGLAAAVVAAAPQQGKREPSRVSTDHSGGAPPSARDEPPTAGLPLLASPFLLGADTRKASVKLSLVALVERYLASPEARRRVSRIARDRAEMAELKAGLEHSFTELRLSGEIAANADRDELICAAQNELWALGPLAVLLERSDWNYVTAEGAGELSVGLSEGARAAVGVIGFSTRASFLAGLRRLQERCEGVALGARGAWRGVLGRCSVQVAPCVGGLSLRVERWGEELLTLEAMALREQLATGAMALAQELVGAERNVLFVGPAPRASLLALASLRAADARGLATFVTHNAVLGAAACSVVRVVSQASASLFASSGVSLLEQPSAASLAHALEAALLGRKGITVVLAGTEMREAVSRTALALSLSCGGEAVTWREALETVFDRYVSVEGDGLSVAGAL